MNIEKKLEAYNKKKTLSKLLKVFLKNGSYLLSHNMQYHRRNWA